jgi:hypothetical protein
LFCVLLKYKTEIKFPTEVAVSILLRNKCLYYQQMLEKVLLYTLVKQILH